ncbi:MAG: adenylyltransferase/cytidyltransferase family protein [Endomicrobium sp.]|jgi:D-beta-D-heptose 7-phosphate kinase/D-beta-D-heptose 1-phosphate adenosyltransferase|nr:adenylyltransferase/cytidyltransferase family protein [Endomicrobium sp.]
MCNCNNKILNTKKLYIKIKELKTKNKKIVFTNGCFDLLHIGHICLFKKAKKLGDILIVAINSDKSLKHIKGNCRPIIKDVYRARILASLIYIDYVTVFNEYTPKKILKKINPNILIKGNEYKTSDIIGREYARKIYKFNMIKNISTTKIIKSIITKYKQTKSI